MFTKWTDGTIDLDGQMKFKQSVRAAKPVFEKLIQIIDQELRILDQSELSQKAYDTPGWDYKQAHRNGLREGLTKIKTLINLDQQKED